MGVAVIFRHLSTNTCLPPLSQQMFAASCLANVAEFFYLHKVLACFGVVGDQKDQLKILAFQMNRPLDAGVGGIGAPSLATSLQGICFAHGS